MGFGEFSKVENTETNKQPIVVENILDAKKKYTKPEVEEFHNIIMKGYPKTNEETLQKILKKLEKNLGEDAITKGFEVIKNELEESPEFLSGEKTQLEINQIIIFIEDEIDAKGVEEVNKKKKEGIEKLQKEIKETTNNLDKFYTDIPEEFKYKKETADSETEKQVDLRMTQNIKDKLKAGGIDEERYKGYLYTALKLSKDETKPISNKVEFIKEFNKFNKQLDIDIEIPVIETRNFKPGKPKADSLDDLETDANQVLAVPSIANYVSTGDNVLSNEAFEKMDIEDNNILKIYKETDIQESINTALKSVNQSVENIAKYFDNGKIDTKQLKKDVDADTYATISKTIAELVISGKEKIKTTTNTIIRQSITTNIFKGLAGYFNVSNTNEENFEKDFKLNVTEDIEMVGKTITLNGSINGYAVGFYYDLETGTLEMDDVVHLNEQKIFQVGEKSGGKLSLPTKLPTLKDLSDVASNVDINTILESTKVENLDDYEKELKSSLDKDLAKEFSHKERNKYYIEKYNEKNLAMQENLGYIFDNLGKTGDIVDFKKGETFAKETKANQYEVFWTMDKSLEHYKNSGQYIQLRNAFEKFNALIMTNKIQDPTKGCKEPMINALFNRDAMKESGKNRKTIITEGNKKENAINYTTLYHILSNDNGIIDLKALEKINYLIEKDETIEQHDKEFSSDVIDKYNVRKAESDLENKLKTI